MPRSITFDMLCTADARRLYIIGVTDQLVHQHVAKDRYLHTSQMLETEVCSGIWPCLAPAGATWHQHGFSICWAVL